MERNTGGRGHGLIAGAAGVALAVLALACGGAPRVDGVMAPIDPPAGEGAMAPHIAALDEGAMMTWLEPSAEQAGSSMRFSKLSRRDGAWSWTAPREIVNGEDLFANWADIPSVGRAADGSLLAHWLARSGDGTYAYDIYAARSTDAGETWSPLGKVNDDATHTEHGFVSMVPEAGGMRLFWLDGRAMAAGGEGHDGDEGPMSLRTCLVTDRIGASTRLDDRVCECCRTGAAVTAGGAVVVYRDRGETEIRDIAIVRRTAGDWAAPASVAADGWEVPGCPVNGPAVASDRDGRRVVVGWFTAAGGAPRVMAVFSGDAGERFSEPYVVDDAAPPGRVDVAFDDAGEALLLWLAAGEGDAAAIRLRRLAADGRMGEPLTVASTSRARGSGFPRMTPVGGGVVVAWTEAGETTHVRATIVPMTSIPPLGEAPVTADAPAPVSPWNGRSGSAAPAYGATAFDGARVTLADMEGRPLLLNFWATWCLPCRREIADLAALYEEYGDDGLRVVGVSLDEAGTEESVRRFVEQQAIPYTILLDPEDSATDLFGLTMLPTSYLFDATGRLVWSREGVISRDDAGLEDAIRRSLGPGATIR